MKVLTLAVIVMLAACGNRNDSSSGSIGKTAGPDVKTLPHDDLMAVVHECHRYGSSDDPKVKYTVDYCSAAQTAHAMEGYSTPSAAPLDPSINKLH